VAHPLGGVRRLSIALSAAVALAMILGTADVSLVAAGVSVLPPPLNLLIFLALATVIIVLSDRLRSTMVLDELAAVRRDMDERDGRIYTALVRRVQEPITVEVPRPRAVGTVAATPAVVGLDPTVLELGRRVSKRMTDELE